MLINSNGTLSVYKLLFVIKLLIVYCLSHPGRYSGQVVFNGDKMPLCNADLTAPPFSICKTSMKVCTVDCGSMFLNLRKCEQDKKSQHLRLWFLSHFAQKPPLMMMLDVSSGTGCLNFGLSLHIHPYFVVRRLKSNYDAVCLSHSWYLVRLDACEVFTI